MTERVYECAFLGSLHKYAKVVSVFFQHDVMCAKLVCGILLHSKIFELAVGSSKSIGINIAPARIESLTSYCEDTSRQEKEVM